MKVAHVVPLTIDIAKSVQPRAQHVRALLRELGRRGHDVTVFSVSGTIPDCSVRSCADSPVDDVPPEYEIAHLLMGEAVYRARHDFDVIHDHTDGPLLPFAKRSDVPIVSTLYEAVSREDWRGILFGEYGSLPYIASSQYLRDVSDPSVSWFETIRMGLADDEYEWVSTPQSYVVRMEDVSKAEGEQGVRALLANAAAFVVSGAHHEEVWLRALQSLAFGTPLVGEFGHFVRELIEPGKNGVLYAEGEANLKSALRAAADLDRRAVRSAFDECCTAKLTAEKYETLYQRAAAAAASSSGR